MQICTFLAVRPAKSAYDTCNIEQDQSQHQKTQTFESSRRLLSKNIIVHVLDVFDHELDSDHAYVPYPALRSGVSGEKLTPEEQKERKLDFLSLHATSLPRFYPFLKPPRRQKGFIHVEQAPLFSQPEIDEKVVKNVFSKVDQVLDFLFRRMASSMRTINMFVEGRSVDSMSSLIVRTEGVTKGHRATVFKLHHSTADQKRTVVIKCHTDVSSARMEREILKSIYMENSTAVPNLIRISLGISYCVAMEDAGQPLSQFSFGGPLMKNVSAKDYEKTFPSCLPPNAFNKLKQLQSIMEVRDVLGDIKPANLLKTNWEDNDLKFIDFEPDMTTWKFAAPEIVAGRYNADKSPLWALELSLLSLVFELDRLKLSNICQSEVESRNLY